MVCVVFIAVRSSGSASTYATKLLGLGDRTCVVWYGGGQHFHSIHSSCRATYLRLVYVNKKPREHARLAPISHLFADMVVVIDHTVDIISLNYLPWNF